MTYLEYRNSFETVEEFRKAFGKLSQEEAYALISTMKGSTTVKASAVAFWRNARDELEKSSSSTT